MKPVTRKSLMWLAGTGTIALLSLGACSPGNNFRDVEGVKSQRPDLVENYNNMDKHPNIGKVCIDGVAFVTTTRQYDSIQRVPEWDKTCPVG